MTTEEYQSYKAMRAFHESPLGKALTRFENAAVALHMYEGYSTLKAKLLVDEYVLRRKELISLYNGNCASESQP